MKYGVITFLHKVANLGDFFQPLAVLEMYRKMGIPESQIAYISFDEMSSYSGEKVILPISAWFGKRPNMNNFPISKDIIPIFFGTHSCDERIVTKLANENLQFFGCRDLETYKWVKASVSENVKVFLSGCFTLLFERRMKDTAQNKVFIIDCVTDFLEYIPNELKSSAVFLNQIDKRLFGMQEDVITQKAFEYAKERLELLRDNAGLVITSRLHIALPCLAMGIPVIVAKADGHETSRFSGYEKILHVYMPHEYSKVDWNPKTVDIEPLKQSIYNLASRLVRSASEVEQVVFDEQMDSDISMIEDLLSDDTVLTNLGETASYLTQTQKEYYWNHKENFSNIFEYIVGEKLNDKTLFIWGAGDKGYWMISRWDYILNCFKDVKFLDRDPKKCGKKFGGIDLTIEEDSELLMELGMYEVMDPSAIKAYNEKDILIIVAINKYYSNAGIAISNDLKTVYGLKEGKNFFFLDKLDNSARMAIDDIALNKVQPM